VGRNRKCRDPLRRRHGAFATTSAAADSEVEKMFRGVGSSQYPVHAFRVERMDSQPWSGVNVYVVPMRAPTG